MNDDKFKLQRSPRALGVRTLARLAIGAALLFCVGTAGAQIITNGTFDSNASGWQLLSSCGDAVWDGGVGNPAGGVRLNSCGQGDSDPRAAQTMHNLVVGAVYNVSVDVQLFTDSSGDGTGKSFGIFLNAQPGNPLVLAEYLDGSWHTLTTTFTATATDMTLVFAAELDARTPGGPGQNTDVAYNIDNVVVTGPTTTPVFVPTMSNLALGMMALLLAACAFVTFGVRRNRRRG